MNDESAHEDVVRRWCAAVTGRDLATVRGLVTESVEFHGPRGVGSGADLVVAWVEHSGIRIKPLLLRDDGDKVVAECEATWPDADPEAAAARTPPMAMVLEFGLVDGRISFIRRFDRPSKDGESSGR
jgi:hypothetical protein